MIDKKESAIMQMVREKVKKLHSTSNFKSIYLGCRIKFYSMDSVR